MVHKSYVFFDCECANTYEGIGKICSLGYVICDDELNVIESEDVVMNPECEFDWYLFSGKGGIKLAYSKDYFRSKPNYESYYKDIKKLLTTGNRYIAGFAVGNDVGFVNNSCERYNLPFIQFRAFDLERYLEKKYEKKQKLSEWAQEFGVNLEKFQTHKSVDDAMMTMLCLKAECMRTGQTVEEIITADKNLFVSNEQILEQAAERAYRKEMMEKISRLFGKVSPRPRFKTLVGKKFELDKKILRDVDYAFELVKRIYDNGGMVVDHVFAGKNAQAFVVFQKVPDIPQLLKKIED
ncbi:MAG: hypothetical protein K6C97_11560, partial [Treponema sp.]|nr:hypothetical protein [Treponema sp.]